MNKNVLVAVAATLLALFASLLSPTKAGSTNEVTAALFPGSIYLDKEELKSNDSYTFLNYQGHIYMPVRLIADNLNLLTYFDEASKNVFLVRNIPVGEAELSIEKAKLFLYENLSMSKINSYELHALTSEEWETAPANAKNMLNPIYWVFDALDEHRNHVTVYVHSNTSEIYFIKPAAE